jgi:hypothetical protein
LNQSLRRAAAWLPQLRGGFLCKAGYNALMKYSLRSLMIVTILAPALLAGGYALAREVVSDSIRTLFYLAMFVVCFVVPGALYAIHRAIVRP